MNETIITYHVHRSVNTSKTLWVAVTCNLCDTEIVKAATLTDTDQLTMHHITKYHSAHDMHLEDL